MIPAMILTLVCVVYRVALGIHGGTEWVNFAPVSALALCGAIFLPRIANGILPLAILAISDLILNRWFHMPLVNWEMGMRYISLAAVIALAFQFRTRLHRWPALLGASLAASIWFYLITNSVSWLTDPAYTKTAAGWLQALTVGLPGYPATWLFFRNSLVSDLLFTGLFVACISCSRNPAANAADSAQNSFKPSICPLQ